MTSGEGGRQPAGWDPQTGKVFGIGFQRTGTSSLTRALNTLGIPTVQLPRPLYDDLDDPIIERYRGFTDVPIPLLYQQLDERHPGSKFIHTVRDEEAWLASVEWLFTTGRLKFKESHERHGNQLNREVFGRDSFDRAHFLEIYRAHNSDVRRYFADRPDDCLTIDVTAGEGFEALCPFLGLPLPAESFPHRNKRQNRLLVYCGRLYKALRGALGG